MDSYLTTCPRKVYFDLSPGQPSDQKIGFRNLVHCYPPKPSHVSTRYLNPPERRKPEKSDGLKPSEKTSCAPWIEIESLFPLFSQISKALHQKKERKKLSTPYLKANPKVQPSPKEAKNKSIPHFLRKTCPDSIHSLSPTVLDHFKVILEL
ncbi:hypothetical protein SCA6_012101 [Theobroma cacao]